MFKKRILMRILDIVACTTISALIIYCIMYLFKDDKIIYRMGGEYQDQTIEISSKLSKEYTNNISGQYFRPSSLPAINDRTYDIGYLYRQYGENSRNVSAINNLSNSPLNTLINYFSILREAENLTNSQQDEVIGASDLPYPVAYRLLSAGYRKRLSLSRFSSSFEGIGHINLIKLDELKAVHSASEAARYFVELEALETSAKGTTYFAYYYGFLYVAPEGGSYKISDIKLFGENFLNAPYHGWSHMAEAVVDIKYGGWCKLLKKRYPTEQKGYVKYIPIKGSDNKDYMFEFYQLTNGTDVEVGQYVKNSSGNWEPVKIDLEKYYEDHFAGNGVHISA